MAMLNYSVIKHSDHAHLPKLTKEHYRVYVFRPKSDDVGWTILSTFYKYLLAVSEYLRLYDYSAGFTILLDFRKVNTIKFLSKVNPVTSAHFITVLSEGYGVRMKRIDLIAGSRMIQALELFLKKILSEKIGNRIRVHTTLNTVEEFYDGCMEILPEEYGGKEISLKELNDKWLETITSKEFDKVYQELNKAKTNESYRQAKNFNEDYSGMPGSFRALCLD